MRGEEAASASSNTQPSELPPHARRRDFWFLSFLKNHGITSACAEKRHPSCARRCLLGNYLRMRGEETHASRRVRLNQELPPHARRRAWTNAGKTVAFGITSACAEKRGVFQHRPRCAGNYLRMRGEEPEYLPRSMPAMELPPHARRRVEMKNVFDNTQGITSACAEKSTRREV